jgi:YD repeat-containing protein
MKDLNPALPGEDIGGTKQSGFGKEHDRLPEYFKTEKFSMSSIAWKVSGWSRIAKASRISVRAANKRYNPPATAITTIILADGTKWTFDYDNYGELAYIGLPTGGSISYTWTTSIFRSGIVTCGGGPGVRLRENKV